MNMIVNKMMSLPVGPHDRVVSTSVYRDYIIVLTERGEVYRITMQSGGGG